jgi:tRNA A-37 threonylcarbamoyl transferase component Bud32
MALLVNNAGMESLNIDPRAERWLGLLGLTTCDAILRCFAPAEPVLSTAVIVTPRTVSLPDQTTRAVFYKLYDYVPSSWRFWGRRSKARCEFENYAAFEKIGIPTAQRVACGEQRDLLGRLRCAFVITEAIPRTWALPQFVEEFCPSRATSESRELRDGLCRQMATLVRRIHDAGFYHCDLVWRNILVTWSPPDLPKIWWIDCPRGGFSQQRRRQLKDLASLDKMAAKHCTRSERMSFLKSYGGDKKLAQDVLTYRQRRWPNE